MCLFVTFAVISHSHTDSNICAMCLIGGLDTQSLGVGSQIALHLQDMLSECASLEKKPSLEVAVVESMM